MSLCPFPTTITITPRAALLLVVISNPVDHMYIEKPYIYIYIYIYENKQSFKRVYKSKSAQMLPSIAI